MLFDNKYVTTVIAFLLYIPFMLMAGDEESHNSLQTTSQQMENQRHVVGATYTSPSAPPSYEQSEADAQAGMATGGNGDTHTSYSSTAGARHVSHKSEGGNGSEFMTEQNCAPIMRRGKNRLTLHQAPVVQKGPTEYEIRQQELDTLKPDLYRTARETVQQKFAISTRQAQRQEDNPLDWHCLWKSLAYTPPNKGWEALQIIGKSCRECINQLTDELCWTLLAGYTVSEKCKSRNTARERNLRDICNTSIDAAFKKYNILHQSEQKYLLEVGEYTTKGEKTHIPANSFKRLIKPDQYPTITIDDPGRFLEAIYNLLAKLEYIEDRPNHPLRVLFDNEQIPNAHTLQDFFEKIREALKPNRSENYNDLLELTIIHLILDPYAMQYAAGSYAIQQDKDDGQTEEEYEKEAQDMIAMLEAIRPKFCSQLVKSFPETDDLQLYSIILKYFPDNPWRFEEQHVCDKNPKKKHSDANSLPMGSLSVSDKDTRKHEVQTLELVRKQREEMERKALKERQKQQELAMRQQEIAQKDREETRRKKRVLAHIICQCLYDQKMLASSNHCEIRKEIWRNRPGLVPVLAPEITEITDELFEKDILTNSLKEMILSKDTQSNKVRTLLDFLERRTPTDNAIAVACFFEKYPTIWPVLEQAALKLGIKPETPISFNMSESVNDFFARQGIDMHVDADMSQQPTATHHRSELTADEDFERDRKINKVCTNLMDKRWRQFNETTFHDILRQVPVSTGYLRQSANIGQYFRDQEELLRWVNKASNPYVFWVDLFNKKRAYFEVFLKDHLKSNPGVLEAVYQLANR